MGEGSGAGVMQEASTFSCQKNLYIFCCKLKIKNVKKNSTILHSPAPSPIFHKASPDQHGFPELEGCSEGWDREEGLWLVREHWPRPHPGLSTFQACILDLKGRLTLRLWTTMAAVWSLQSGGERPEHSSGGNSPGRPCLAVGIVPSGPWAHVPHTPPHPQPQDNACPAYPISGSQRLPEL